MGTGYVSTTHQSGGLVSSDVIPDRVNAKIGVAETGEANKPYLIYNYNQAKDIFTKGELLDHIEQYFEEFDTEKGIIPVPIYAIRPVNDSAGSIATPVKVGTGTATTATGGTPTGTRTVKIKITKAGACGVAEYRKSLDGGITYSAPLVTPASASPISLDVGVTLTFTNGATPSASFVVDDLYTIEITGPGATTASMLDALDANKRLYATRWFHIIGAATRAFAVSVNALLEEMESIHNLPVFVILENRPIANSGETIAEYYQALDTEFDPFYSDRVVIVSAQGKYIPGGVANAGGYQIVKEANVGEWRNAATFLTAKLASCAVSVSAAYVKEMKSLTFSEIRHWNEGYRDYMELLHDKRHCVLKEYNDYPGIFISRDRIKSHPDSDFIEIPERRRADKMHRLVYQTSLPFLNQDTETKSGSGGMDFVKLTCDAEVSKQMEQSGSAEISGHTIVLDPDKSFKTTRILKAQLAMKVAGRIKAIEWTTSFAPIN